MNEAVLAALSGQYRVERELAGGGMSRVFLAEETALGRRVVIKVLPEGVAHAVSIERFKREITVAAQLSHPHIVPVLSAGDVAGQPYYVMPFVDGESMRAHLDRGPMPWQAAVRILRQVVSALSVAHARGIVHRDIKPENILITGDAAAVTDFGVAKALAASTQSGKHTTLTEAGIALGTPAYMAPEQAIADAAMDHRADIYAFGCVAYEMIAGQTPFHGRGAAQQLAAHVHETPRALTAVAKDVPPALSALIMRCLAKDANARPRDAVALGHELEAAVAPPRASRARTFAIAASLVIVGAVGAFLALRAPTSTALPAPYIAVLPLMNEGPDSARLFVDGLSGAISERLGTLSGLHVIDHQSAIAVATPNATAKEMGAQLDADYLLRGTVRWDPVSISRPARLTVTLINAKDGSTRWTSKPISFTPSVDPFAVQQDVAISVAEALNVAITPADSTAIATSGTRNVEAFTQFLTGQGIFVKGTSVADYRRSLGYYERAIQLDPAFLQAQSRWIDASVLLSMNSEGPPLDSVQRVLAAMQRRAPNDANTLYSAAQLLLLQGDPNLSMAAWNRALAAAPNHPQILAQAAFARFWVTEDADAIIELFARAVKLAPMNPDIVGQAAYGAFFTGRFDEAQALATRLAAVTPMSPVPLDIESWLRVARVDSAGVLDRYRELIAKFGKATPSAATNLLHGTREAIQALASIEFANVHVGSGLDTLMLLTAKALAQQMLGNATAARQTLKTASDFGERPRAYTNWLDRLMMAFSRAMPAAALGDRERTASALAEVRTITARFPERSAGRSVGNCTSATAYALLRDSTAMYPYLEKCLQSGRSSASGIVPPALKRDPRFAPFRDQPHFQRIADAVVITRRGG